MNKVHREKIAEKRRTRALVIALVLSVSACAASDQNRPFAVEDLGRFEEPWAMAFLPDGGLLVTEKAGRPLPVPAARAARAEVAGVPDVDYGGQG